MTAVPAAVQRRITWLAYAAVLLTGLNAGWVGPLLPSIARAQGLALDRAGLLVSAIFAGFCVTVLLGGEVVDRWGGRVALALAAGLIAAGLLGLATLPGLPALLASAFVIGLGTGVSDVSSHVVIAALNRERVAAALNYLNVSFGVGALVGPVVVGFALRAGLPYGAVFGAGAAAAALVVALLLATPLVHERGAGATARDKATLLARPVLWVLGGVLFLYIAAEAGVGSWLAAYLDIVDNVDEAVASWGVSLFWPG
jgi:FHS family glucose/mannose:H+ symporter-like MFS transporter